MLEASMPIAPTPVVVTFPVCNPALPRVTLTAPDVPPASPPLPPTPTVIGVAP